MKRAIPVVLGALLGAGVATAVVVVAIGGIGRTDSAPTVEPTPVRVAGKLGPHLVLADRVFNLRTPAGAAPAYAKIQTTIEFETTSAAWARVLNGCAMDVHPTTRTDTLVTAGAGGASTSSRPAPEEQGPAEGPCAAEERLLLADFDHDIGTGRQLIEDALTGIITRLEAAEIATPQGKEALKEAIRRRVEELIPEHRAVRVLFSTFIIQ